MTRSFLFWATLLIFFKIILTAFFPVIGDEAYYIYWGMHPAGGYYDLPPMIGWWLIPFTRISLSPLWLRLPNLLTSAFVTFGIYEWLQDGIGKVRARSIAALFLFLPIPFLAVLMFPDIPLLALGFFSALLFYRAVTNPSRGISLIEFLLSGALFGAAFLSKYFAVMFLPAFAIWFILEKRKSWLGLILFGVGALPFFFQHLFWNSQHCWANFVFNLVTRQKAYDGTIFQTFGFFVLYLLIVSTPILWSAFSGRLQVALDAGFQKADRLKSMDRFFLLLWLIPVLLFALTAMLGKGQGLHWLLFITPYFVVWAGLRFTPEELARKISLLIKTTGVISLIALLVLIFPAETIGRNFEHRFSFEYQLLIHPDDFIEAVKPKISKSVLVFTEGYTLSSVIDYQFKRFAEKTHISLPDVSVWGGGSRFGREFDWTTDWKSLDGKQVALITPGRIDTVYWAQFFETFSHFELMFQGQSFHLSVGTGFKAEEYVNKEFKKAANQYYPPFLPGACSLKE